MRVQQGRAEDRRRVEIAGVRVLQAGSAGTGARRSIDYGGEEEVAISQTSGAVGAPAGRRLGRLCRLREGRYCRARAVSAKGGGGDQRTGSGGGITTTAQARAARADAGPCQTLRGGRLPGLQAEVAGPATAAEASCYCLGGLRAATATNAGGVLAYSRWTTSPGAARIATGPGERL